MVTNENNTPAEAPKKRSRLFGGRKAAAQHVNAAQPEPTPVVEAPAAPVPVAETPVAEAPVAETPTVEAPVVETVDAEASASAAPKKAPVRRSATRKAAASTVDPSLIDTEAVAAAEAEEDLVIEDAPARRTPPRPTTSLLFQAPDLPPLPPLPARTQQRRDSSQRDSEPRANGRDSDPRDTEPRDGDQYGDEQAAGVRRRSRRRPGEEPRDGDNDPNTVVKVRQPRKEPVLITEPQRVKGSTRLEAKKQRRRDGRDAGRRRPVVTEAEFLARRESVDRLMVVRASANRIQIGVLEDGVLVEHYVAKAAEASLIGNVYLGRVQNVLPSMEAAFVDIGRGRNAVLYSGEVDWDAAAANAEGDAKNQPRRIELALKPGDRVLVQVTKDPVGHKGARLTSQVSLPGRYLVYVPNGSMNGISRKLPDTERARLKTILKQVLPENVGVIVRTASEGATEEQLTLDVNRLTSQWAEISRLVETSQAPVLLHSEPDLLVKIVRDVFNEDFQKLVIAGDDAQGTIENYLRSVAPDLLDRVEKYEGDGDAFDAYRISEQIEKALDRKVWLPSGGSLVIDRTEAMTVVDVNTGKFVGSGGNLEETVTKNNLEAAEEIVRQLRLRDIGGIIVVDFIDMVLESNRDLVLRRLVECLSRDRTKHQVAEVTSLGLVQMTRKKLGLGLLESFSEPCEHCAGRGIIVHHDPVTRHRQTAQPAIEGSGRRNRGGNKGPASSGPAATAPRNSGNGGANAGSPNTGTHAITEDVRNALAQIAASTVHADQVAANEAEAAKSESNTAVVETQAPAEVSTAPQQSSQPEQRSGRSGSRRARGGQSTGSQSTGGQAPVASVPAPESARPETVAELAPSVAAPVEIRSQVEEATVGAAEAAVAILDIPVSKSQRAPRRISTKDAEEILDSVLGALPEPKQPGQGRSRVSRRASSSGTGIITTESGEPAQQ
jgi:ribonuclease E